MSSTAAGDNLIDHLTTREGYDGWAGIYDDEDNPLIRLETPQVELLLGDVRGLNVADIGCGTGRHALACSARGARVTGLDFSEGMLAKARAKPGAEGVRWIAHDLASRWPLESEAFDRVICGLVLEHIADLKHLFEEMGRIVRRDGWIVVSAMHPAMMLRGVQARYTNPQTGRETRPRSYPHSISDFVMAAVRAGLRIEHLSERAVDEALAEQSPRARKYLGWPMLVMMGLRR